jgi:hypothetical protein
MALLQTEIDELTPDEKGALDLLIKDIAGKQAKEIADAAERLEWDSDTGPAIPIRQWVNDEYYLGETARTLWPRLKEDMIEYFEGDYAECILTGSTRWGKDYFSTTALIRIIYELYCLKRPTDTLGLGRGEIIHIVPISHTKEAAQRVVFQGIVRKLALTPFWKGRFEVTKEEIRFPGKDIIIIGGGSNEGAALGLNVWAALIDEGNFMGKQKKGHVAAGGGKDDKSESIYDSLRRRIRGTYSATGLRGRLIMISSKKSIYDFTERRLREAMRENDTSVFVRDYATWDVRPNAFMGQKWWRAAVSQKIGRVRVLDDGEEVEDHEIWFRFPDEYLQDFLNDPAGAARDIAGIALESFRPFFSNREAIDAMMKPERAHPFHIYEWVTSREIKPIWDNMMIRNVHGDPVPRCCPNAHRHVHMDLSKNKDATGFCVGHVAGEVEVSRLDPETHEKRKEDAPLIHIDLCLRILAPHAGEIEHQLVRSLIYMLREGGLPIKSVSADRWMGLPNLQLIAKHGFKTQEISTQRTLDPYLSAQGALYEGRIESPVYTFLAKELRELELNSQGTKVDHPRTGCFAGDTKVRLLDGRAITFEQLVAEYGEGQRFHTYTMREGAVSVGIGYAPRLTAKNAPVVAVTLDNGETVRCTPDHRFMLRDGSYREAGELQPGDSLMPLYTKLSTKSAHKMVGYELYLCPGDGKWHFTHRMVGKWKYPGYTGNQHGNGLIHHDRGKLNNAPDAFCIAPGNHKVVSVEPSGTADVYDISVEETSNFALDAGIFVHNSKDLADAFAAVCYFLATNWRSIGGGGISMGASVIETPGLPGEAVPTSDGNFRWPDEPPLPTEGGEDWTGLPTWII